MCQCGRGAYQSPSAGIVRRWRVHSARQRLGVAVLARELVGVVVVDQRLPAPGWWPCWLHADEGSVPQVVTTTATDVCKKSKHLFV